MGFFRNIINNLSSGSSGKEKPGSLPNEYEMDLPPLPPERNLEPMLPNLSPDSEAPPAPAEKEGQNPQQEFPAPQPEGRVPAQEETNGPYGYDPYQSMSANARLPLGAQSTAPSPEATEEREKPAKEGPIYVRIDDFRLFMEGQSLVKNNLKEADNIITRLNEIKIEEDKEFERWRASLEDINKRINFIDRKIFESG